MKSTCAGVIVAAGLLVTLLMPSQASASCICFTDRFNASGSAVGDTCTAAQNNLISSLSSAATQSCQFQGYDGACNVVIRTGACTSDYPFSNGFHVDGTAKYSCFICF
ncbi:MAG TPA: hypothetical protein VGX68_24450 [Thermoanaerobaculia bacterium]|nr:hypothetical protein [Thermoanaerobaculia bacterium]